MFAGTSVFNQNVGNWDVSKGTSFVSIILTSKDLNLIWNYTWILTCVSFNNHYLPFSEVCSLELPYSIKILATGMFLRVQALWVLFWLPKILIWFDIIHEYSYLYHLTITIYHLVRYVRWHFRIQSKYWQLGCF